MNTVVFIYMKTDFYFILSKNEEDSIFLKNKKTRSNLLYIFFEFIF